METDFFQNLLNLYNQINFSVDESEISKIDKHITYYLADIKNEFIVVNKPNIIDIDIKSAFPTIVNCMFGVCDFTKKLNKLTNKKEKNIFIATTLKETDYLRRINMISKMIIYGIIKENCSDYILLELKKDGILLQCDNINLEKLFLAINGKEYLRNSLTEFVIKSGFNFHTTSYQSYCRCNRTSFFIKDHKLKVKGKYKYLPPKLRSDLLEYIVGKKKNLTYLKEIYSNIFLNIIRIEFLKDIIEDYYLCENKKVLDSNNNYVPYNYSTLINPKLYLRNFVFPIIASMRI